MSLIKTGTSKSASVTKPRVLRAGSHVMRGQGEVSIGPAAVAATGQTSMESPPHREGCSEPTISLQRNGEEIESIEIVCACGETIVIRCDYA